jgi:hypothetical protein
MQHFFRHHVVSIIDRAFDLPSRPPWACGHSAWRSRSRQRLAWTNNGAVFGFNFIEPARLDQGGQPFGTNFD